MKRCLVIAPLVSHATAGRIAALVNTNYQVSLLDISRRETPFRIDLYPYNRLKQIYDLRLAAGRSYDNPGHFDRLKDLLRSCNIIAESREVSAVLCDVLQIEKPDVIVAYYGPAGLHFCRLIKKIDVRNRIVFIPNLVPSTIISGNSVVRAIKSVFANEFVDYENWIREIDRIICASEEMRDFLCRRFLYPRSNTRILPDFLPAQFQLPASSISLSPARGEVPRVIFFGAPERWGGTIDCLDKDFSKLESAGIRVYASAGLSAQNNVPWSNYPRFSDDDVFSGKLSRYGHQFDAALVTYNVSNRRERFRSTLPTRFFSSLAAGLPIALKGGIFDAVESFIKRYEIGFTFDSALELRRLLEDRDRLLKYRRNVCELLPVFCAESQSASLQDLMNELTL